VAASVVVENLERVYSYDTGFWRRRRKEVQALAGISFSIQEGEIFGLLGPNGAGKTTTIKILSTLLLPTAGRAEVLGVDVARYPGRVRPYINVVFGGERTLYWRLSGRENLAYFADLYRVPPRRQRELIPELLELAGLTKAADRRVETYSKGMKQRLSVVRGLVNDPKVLFLDEPTIGLDPTGAQELRQLVAQLADRGTTILLTTHYMHEAEFLCRRIAIIDKGRLRALDTPAALTLLAVGLSVVEVQLRGPSAADVEAVRRTAGGEAVRSLNLGDRLLLEFPTERPEELVEALRALPGLAGSAVRTREATLEDAYLRLVGGGA